MATNQFLNDFHRDLIAVVGVVGFVLTAIGVWLTRVQMLSSISVAKAASEAAIQALNESKRNYNHFVITQSSRLLTEARVPVRNESWILAAMRLGDLADLLLHVAGDEKSWSAFADRLSTMQESFARIESKQIQKSVSLMNKWHALDRDVQTTIANSLTPFKEKLTDDRR